MYPRIDETFGLELGSAGSPELSGWDRIFVSRTFIINAMNALVALVLLAAKATALGTAWNRSNDISTTEEGNLLLTHAPRTQAHASRTLEMILTTFSSCTTISGPNTEPKP